MYLDPGFGGMLVQIVVFLAAVGGGVLFALRKKIKKLFSRGKADTVSKAEMPSQGDVSGDDAVDMLDDAVDMLHDDKK